MKNPVMKITILLYTIFAFMVVGCGSEKGPDKVPAAPGVPEAVTPRASDTNSATDKIKFKNADGKEVLVIKRYADHDKLEVNFSESAVEIKARANDKGRVKYKIAAASQEKDLLAKVKYKEGSIKLVNDSEELLYKIKWTSEKVKIANNEEMTNPYELKRKSEEKVGVKDQAGKEIGKVKFYADNGKLKVKDAQEKEILISKDLKLSAAPGVILYEDININLRCVIISELLKKGL